MIWNIYKITNQINGKVYIGQTIKDLKERFLGHCHQKGCIKLHNSIKKYGRNNFSIEPLAFCLNKDESDELEKSFIIYFNSIKEGYNICKGGEGTVGRVHSEETKSKIRQSNKGKIRSEETKINISISGIGRKHSRESKNKISNTLKGRISPNKGNLYSEETKLKISQSNKGKHSLPRSEEAKKKMSESHKGINKGRTWVIINNKRVWKDVPLEKQSP